MMMMMYDAFKPADKSAQAGLRYQGPRIEVAGIPENISL